MILFSCKECVKVIKYDFQDDYKRLWSWIHFGTYVIRDDVVIKVCQSYSNTDHYEDYGYYNC